MKRLQKLAALLLAGAMMLVLFTACSGESGRDTESEAMVLSAINNKRSSGTQAQTLSNDAALQKLAWDALCDIQVDADSGKGQIAWNKAHKITQSDGKATIVNVATAGGVSWDSETNTVKVNATAFQSTSMDKLLTDCNLFIKRNDFSVDFNVNSPWVKVGVAARRVNGQTYIAVAVEVNAS